MPDKDTQKAKEMFLNYNCSHFRMDREGDYDEYKRFNVSIAQERIWLNEYQDELVLKIKSADVNSPLFCDVWTTIESTAFNYIEPNKLSYLLPLIRNKLNNADPFTKLLVAEGMRRIVNVLIDNMEINNNITINVKGVIGEAKQVALSILENILNNPITMHEHYRKSALLEYLISDKKEIIKRAKEEIREWNSLKERAQ